MALGDIILLEQASSQGGRGARLYNIPSASAVVNAGEPVQTVLGSPWVSPCATNAGTTTTDFIVGIAATTSNNSATANGTVNVIPINNGQTWLISPKTSATWDTQAEYDALVGDRVTIDLTSSSYTLNATDAAGNGCVVQPLDIAKYPGKVAIAFRAVCSNLQ